ncbi:MAG: LamG-like jellyroll fold domain-containing protein [Opitutaceae bacterium]
MNRLLLTALISTVPAMPIGATAPEAALRAALVFHAPFDTTADAAFAKGDPRVYTAADRAKRTNATPGLPPAEDTRIVPDAGRFGGALEFRRKIKPQVVYRGGDNLGYQPRNWQGSVSFWLRLDPDRDLEPGYCDPVQFVGQAWNEGNLFVEFSKDHTPRHFRFAIMAVTRFWNPQNRKWEEMPEPERPMTAVHRPPFSRERWTHVLITFSRINSGAPDGRGTLYLDGVKQGSFTGWNNTFNRDVSQSALTVGLAYTGLIDDLAVFNRELDDAEAAAVFALPRGIAGLAR